MMDFLYLGTGAAEGIPALFCECDVCAHAQRAGGKNLRLRSGALVDERIMIDFPPDTLSVKHRLGLNLAKVEHIFFTHSHLDHLAAGELCYRAANYCVGRQNPIKLHLHGNEKVLDVIRKMFLFDMDKVADCVQLHPVEAFVPVEAGGITFTPLPANHDKREPCMLYLLEKGDARLLYANDTGALPEQTIQFLAGKRLSVVSLDCTMGMRQHSGGHMGLPDNLLIKQRLMAQGSADECTQFIAHHISHNDNVSYDSFAERAAGTGFVCSYDGMRLCVEGVAQ